MVNLKKCKVIYKKLLFILELVESNFSPSFKTFI